MNCEQYLSRLGIDPLDIKTTDVETLERLQRAHVTTIPFETLSITGDPHGSREGDGISLGLSDLYEKIVIQKRGGFCYELNELFAWLLTDLGFEVRRVAARIKSNGEFGPPADHLTLLVSLDRRYVVDVGLGLPKLRHPLALDGTTHKDNAGIQWRITSSDRPDADYAIQYNSPDSTEWAMRCIFKDQPRDLNYFEATCDYFQHAPESAFTGDPVVTLASERGHLKVSPTTVTRSVRGDTEQQSISSEEWYRVLEQDFGIAYRPEQQVEQTMAPGQ